MLSNSDIRIVNGDFNTVIGQLEQYLQKVNFEITEKTLHESKCYIKAENKCRSFSKLFWTSKPQITRWKIEKYSDKEVKIKAKTSSFQKFKYYFYGIVLFLLSFASSFFIVSLSIKGEPVFSLKIYSIFLALLITACCFFLWLIRTKPHAYFFDEYYKNIQKIILKKEQAIELHPSFPEIIPGFIIFLMYMLLLLSFAVMESIKGIGTLWIMIALLGLLIVLLFVAILFAEKTVRTIFILTAISFCLPLAVYSNLPALILGTEPAFKIVGQIVKKNDLLEKRLKQHPKISKEISEDVKIIKKDMHKVSVILCVFCGIIILVILILLKSMLYLPILVLRRIDNFNTRNKESLYFQAMKSEKFINPFNCCVIGIWLLLGAANLSGLFFSLAILGKTFGLDHFIIKSGISDLFFDSSRMMFSYLLLGTKNIGLIHSFVMLLYSLPMPLLFSIVIIKNIRHTLKTALFLQNKTIGISLPKLTTKVKTICKDCNLNSPIIRVVNAEKVNEGASYLGLPVFRNLLIIRKQTLEILDRKDFALDAYLAHEIFHLKEHTFTWKILCLLSDFTLFGNGFLTILHSSHDVELKADAFAVNWLKQHNMPPRAIISALQAQEELREQEYFGMLLNNLNFTQSVERAEYRQAVIEQFENSGKLKKALINLKLLYQIYFGEYITSYIHPSNEYRIEQIEENISEAV